MEMTLTEIAEGIVKILDEKMEIEHITTEDIRNSDKEFLHIQLIPLVSKTAAAGYFKDKEILVDIAYMEKLHTSNKRNYEILEQLDNAFTPYFPLCGRYFTCDGQMDITDDIAHYKMTLKFSEAIAFTPCQMAEGLSMDWRI